MYGVPKGAFVLVVKKSSVLTMPDIKEAFKKQLEIEVTGSTSNYDIEKMF